MQKKSLKSRKIRHLFALCLIISCLSLLYIPLTSAWFETLENKGVTPTMSVQCHGFNEKGVYGVVPCPEFSDVQKDAQKYPVMAISDWLGFGGELWSGTLLENTPYCLNTCYAIYESTTAEDSALIDDVKFEGGYVNSYKITYFNGSTITKTKDKLENVCVDGKTYENGSIEQICHLENIPQEVEVEVWNDYNLGEVLPAGTYKVKLEAKKSEGSSTDWKVMVRGNWINDWAVWNSSKNVGLNYYYRFDENTGTTASNAVNGLFNLTYSGTGGGWTTGIKNSAFNLNGTAYFHYDPIVDTTGMQTAFTISEWVYFNSSICTANDCVMFDSKTSAGGYWISYTQAAQFFSYRAGSTPQVTYSIPKETFNNKWMLVTATKSPNMNISLYINGSIVGSIISNTNATVDQFAFGGQSEGGGNFFGRVDEVGIWNRSLSPSEVSDLWNAGSGIFYTSSSLPVVTLNSPADNAQFNISNPQFNCSATTTANYANTTLYTNKTGTWRADATSTNNGDNITDSGFTNGYYVWNCNVCDINSNCSFAASNRTILINGTFPASVTINNLDYTSSVYSSTSTGFIANTTFSGTNLDATLWYNNTAYPSTKFTLYSNTFFINNITVVNVLTSTTKNFFYEFKLTNSTGLFSINSSTYSQTILPIIPINVTSGACPTGTTAAFYFDFKDETNSTYVNATSINYNFQYGYTNNTALVANGSLIFGSVTNVNNFSICINNTSPTYFVGYGEIQYGIENDVNRRFYIFQNTRATNTTISNSLYGLQNGLATQFQITAEDTSLNPYVGYYIALLRWYPQQNIYNVVDMGKTDNNGQTVLNVKTYDVDYRLALYQPDGTLVKLFSPIRMVCSSTPCTYSMIVSGANLDLTTFLNVQQNLSFNPTTKIYSFIWSDASQNTKAMNLLVYKVYADKDDVLVCNQSATGFIGVLTCDVSAQSGQLRAEAWRSASPAQLIAQIYNEIRQTINDIGGGDFGLFLGLVLAIVFGLIGATISPVMMIILSIIALIPAVVLGSLTLSIFMIITAIGGLLLHWMKRVNG